jgi:hypothetical protein
MPWSRSNNHGDTWKKQPNLLTFITVALSEAKNLYYSQRRKPAEPEILRSLMLAQNDTTE